jgi:hypothetical protein
MWENKRMYLEDIYISCSAASAPNLNGSPDPVQYSYWQKPASESMRSHPFFPIGLAYEHYVKDGERQETLISFPHPCTPEGKTRHWDCAISDQV